MKQVNEKRPHISVMGEEFLKYFEDQKISVFFDGTLGAGGHAELLLKAHPEIKTYIGCDQDPEALAIAKEYLAPWKDKMVFVQGNFSHLDEYLDERKIKNVDGFFLI